VGQHALVKELNQERSKGVVEQVRIGEVVRYGCLGIGVGGGDNQLAESDLKLGCGWQ
jgi:hypothetical protein